jgi:hypothetical protein
MPVRGVVMAAPLLLPRERTTVDIFLRRSRQSVAAQIESKPNQK